ncbi:MAG: succinate dehydrogenase, cytochrome b556 subunit [Gammaproteobacteria bacterium]|nr:succinate dehydrogenase, cytochrome b556 subunit [Gammaproteobacteria bacterium]MCH9744930.1 succinate dehydrogenase, cytochrome b556 subunit [Gammaproteobacteria bacterium]
MRTQRPVFLNLTQIKFPPMAIASILHRITGVLLFLFVPLLLYLLSISITGPTNFAHFEQIQQSWWVHLLLWIGASAVCYHILAGFRHLIMDFGFGESVSVARVTALLVIALAVVCVILMGVWIW